MSSFSAVRARRMGAGVATLLAVSVGACKDFTSIEASFANLTVSDTVYALNGAPPNAPTAIKFFDGSLARADQGFGFDIAFDVDASGRAVILPMRAVASGLVNPGFVNLYSVGLLTVPLAFEQVLSAPKETYRVDTAMVVNLNQTVVVESNDPAVCGFAIKGGSYFAKIVITAVDVPKRKIAFTVTMNRNCGFRSLEPGIPRD